MNISISLKGITIKLHPPTKKVFFKSLFYRHCLKAGIFHCILYAFYLSLPQKSGYVIGKSKSA